MDKGFYIFGGTKPAGHVVREEAIISTDSLFENKSHKVNIETAVLWIPIIHLWDFLLKAASNWSLMVFYGGVLLFVFEEVKDKHL